MEIMLESADRESQKRVDPKVVQTFFLMDIAEKLDKLINLTQIQRLNPLPFWRFVSVYQTRIVSAGETGVIVWEFPVKPFIAYAQVIANSWVENTVLHMFIDNQEVEAFERIVAQIDNPLILPKPYIAKKRIHFTADNNDSNSHIFQVVLDGQVYTKSEGELLGATAPRGQ